ncbi:polysaccharide pyruvyl transferase family protein [Gammaproteobacteria bacterium]|nr:polysaccharide pyruvyl transferase family protein [Gammaproteobacteria bacterium]
MKRFYLNGIHSLENRGVDAIVRSTAALLKEEFGEVELFFPSKNILLDQSLWPNSQEDGVYFIKLYSPFYRRPWQFIQRKLGFFLPNLLWPFPFPKKFVAFLQTIDIVLSVGGDNYSSEYGFPSFLIGVDDLAIKMNKPIILWGASIGPFTKNKNIETIMAKHLSNMSLITVRETLSEEYVKINLSLQNTMLFPDSAFSLQPKHVDLKSFWPIVNQDRVVGLNVSPYLQRFGDNSVDYVNEFCRFIEALITEHNCSVLLIPHVIFRSNTSEDDLSILRKIYLRLNHLTAKVSLLENQHDSAQIKYIIGNCKYFIGARTHSTIAALSSFIPTLSIAYSVKARGINKDLFDHEEYVLDISNITSKTLMNGFQKLVNEEMEIKKILERKISSINRELRKATSLLN